MYAQSGTDSDAHYSHGVLKSLARCLGLYSRLLGFHE